AASPRKRQCASCGLSATIPCAAQRLTVDVKADPGIPMQPAGNVMCKYFKTGTSRFSHKSMEFAATGGKFRCFYIETVSKAISETEVSEIALLYYFFQFNF
ncbi:MAG: hypothetical protein LBK13_04750, partial [Spirochaetales bacterium]|nr:hypothetical protein [Spirochaetales bacterium]